MALKSGLAKWMAKEGNKLSRGAQEAAGKAIAKGAEGAAYASVAKDTAGKIAKANPGKTALASGAAGLGIGAAASDDEHDASKPSGSGWVKKGGKWVQEKKKPKAKKPWMDD